MRSLLPLLALAIVGCGAANGRATSANDLPHARFDELDADQNRALDSGEFSAVVEALYAHLDDGDGVLAAAEMGERLFDVWDTDGSGSVDSSELARARVAWFPHQSDADFVYWDADASGAIDREEHARGIAEARLVQAYDRDADGRVSNDELARTLFTTWDVDGDRAIDALEWRFDG